MSYPSDLNPTLKTDWANNTLVENTHPDEHNYVASAVDALKAKVGANGSAVTTSHDYKLGEVISTDKAVGKSATQTLTNKTLTSPTITDPTISGTGFTNANHTHEGSTTGGQLNATNVFSTGTVPTSRLGSGSAGSSNFLRGDQTWAAPTIVVAPELVSSIPAGGAVSRQHVRGYYDTTDGFVYSTGQDTNTINFQYGTVAPQIRLITSDWATAEYVKSAVVIGAYLYLYLMDDTVAVRVYRYDKTNLAAGGTLMTISGQAFAWNNDAQIMSSDGTSFYFNYKAGNSANDYVISKYSLSGTTLTYVSDITCGSTGGNAARIVAIDSSTNLWLWKTDGTIRKYNSSGTLQSTSNDYFTGINGFFTWGSIIYGTYNHTNGGGSSFYYATKITLV